MKFIGEPIRSTILIATKENRTRPLISLSSPNTKFGVLLLGCEKEAPDFLSFPRHGDSTRLGQLHPKHSQRREPKRRDRGAISRSFKRIRGNILGKLELHGNQKSLQGGARLVVGTLLECFRKGSCAGSLTLWVSGIALVGPLGGWA